MDSTLELFYKEKLVKFINKINTFSKHSVLTQDVIIKKLIKPKIQNVLPKKNKGQSSKGQLISKCLFDVIVWTKKPTKFFPGFLP